MVVNVNCFLMLRSWMVHNYLACWIMVDGYIEWSPWLKTALVISQIGPLGTFSIEPKELIPQTLFTRLPTVGYSMLMLNHAHVWVYVVLLTGKYNLVVSNCAFALIIDFCLLKNEYSWMRFRYQKQADCFCLFRLLTDCVVNSPCISVVSICQNQPKIS